MTEFALITSTYLDKRAKEIPLSQPFNLGKTDFLGGKKTCFKTSAKHLLIYLCMSSVISPEGQGERFLLVWFLSTRKA